MSGAVLNLFPTSGLDQTIHVAVLVGLLTSLLLTEWLGWVWSGLVVPGYLRVRLIAGDKLLWNRDFYTRSRQSKARREGGVWLDENAFSLEPGVEVSDARQMILDLPSDLPPGAELHVTLAGGDARAGLVRLYSRRVRAPQWRTLRLQKLAPAEREALADRMSYLPWDRLGAAELLGRLRVVDERVPAVGLDGADYNTSVL
jgi:hypothetical protein